MLTHHSNATALKTHSLHCAPERDVIQMLLSDEPLPQLTGGAMNMNYVFIEDEEDMDTPAKLKEKSNPRCPPGSAH